MKNCTNGLLGVYVDDSSITGNDEFLKHTDKSLEKFEFRSRVLDNFSFAGVQITTYDKGFSISQKATSTN